MPVKDHEFIYLYNFEISYVKSSLQLIYDKLHV